MYARKLLEEEFCFAVTTAKQFIAALENKHKRLSNNMTKEQLKDYNKQRYQATKEYHKQYREANRVRRKQWGVDNKERVKKYLKTYNEQNKEKIKQKIQANRELSNEYYRERRKKDPNFKIKWNLRSRLSIALKRQHNSRANSTLELVGCTIDELRQYIESQWLPGMNWSNNTTNGWHIDHIKPCNTFDLTDPLQQKECFHFSNLRPLWAKENLSRPRDGSDLTVPKEPHILNEQLRQKVSLEPEDRANRT